MFNHRTGVVIGAALSAAVLGALPAAAQQRGTTEAARTTATPAEPAQPAPAPAPENKGLLMDTLDRAGIAGPLEDARIRLFGYIEGSYTWNPDPTNHFFLDEINLDRIFDTPANEALLNQINLTAERAVEPSGKEWDVGFRTEMIYGQDARYIHSNGMNFYGPQASLGAAGYFQADPKNQFDLFQAYADVRVPVGNGLVVRMGKFASFFGGTVDPNGNTFYSRSLIFATSHPFTFTGVLGRYDVTPDLRVEAGITRGWDQSLEDNNDAIDALMRVSYILGRKTALYLAAVTGPEQDDNNSDYRTLIETGVKYQATEKLRLTLTGTYGQDARVTLVDVDGNVLFDEPDVRWYAVTGYTSYTIDKHVQFNTRLEWLRDEKGFATGLAGNTVSGTLGVTVTPFPDDRIGRGLKVRPEIRVDYSNDKRYAGSIDADANNNPIANTDANSQVTFGIDAIFNF